MPGRLVGVMDVEIRFTDATYETVYMVDLVKIHDDHLSLYVAADEAVMVNTDIGPQLAAHRHAGSFPLINIHRWKVVKP